MTTSTKKKKLKADALEMPTTREEAEKLLGDIGAIQREVIQLEACANDELAKIKEVAEALVRPLNEEIEAKFAALHAWAEANRGELLKDGGKTAKLATGELLWRVTPPAVTIKGAEFVVDRLKQHGLDRFVRTKEEPNKAAMLDDPDAVKGIKGISITQREEFVAKPFSSELEKASTSKAVEG